MTIAFVYNLLPRFSKITQMLLPCDLWSLWAKPVCH